MRFILCAAALLCLGSYSHAGRIQIAAATANYVTADDEVQIEIWFDQPFDFETNLVQFYGGDEAAITGSGDGVVFTFRNAETGNLIPTDTFNLATYTLTNGGSGNTRIETPDIDYNYGQGVREGLWRYIIQTVLPADLVRFDDYTPNEEDQAVFFYGVVLRDAAGVSDTFMSYSTVDMPGYEEIFVPEPSSLVLLAAAHLYWLPRLRQRLSKRRMRMESDRIDG